MTWAKTKVRYRSSHAVKGQITTYELQVLPVPHRVLCILLGDHPDVVGQRMTPPATTCEVTYRAMVMSHCIIPWNDILASIRSILLTEHIPGEANRRETIYSLSRRSIALKIISMRKYESLLLQGHKTCNAINICDHEEEKEMKTRWSTCGHSGHMVLPTFEQVFLSMLASSWNLSIDVITQNQVWSPARDIDMPLQEQQRGASRMRCSIQSQPSAHNDIDYSCLRRLAGGARAPTGRTGRRSWTAWRWRSEQEVRSLAWSWGAQAQVWSEKSASSVGDRLAWQHLRSPGHDASLREGSREKMPMALERSPGPPWMQSRNNTK